MKSVKYSCVMEWFRLQHGAPNCETQISTFYYKFFSAVNHVKRSEWVWSFLECINILKTQSSV